MPCHETDCINVVKKQGNLQKSMFSLIHLIVTLQHILDLGMEGRLGTLKN